MRIGKFAIAAVVATALTGTEAQAQMCGGSDFKTCASVTIAQTVGTGSTRVQMWVMNNSGLGGTFAGTIFGSFGVFGLPAGLSASNFSWFGNGNWALGTSGLSGAGITNSVFGAQFSGPGGVQANGLKAGQAVMVEFDLSGTGFDQVALDKWAVHGQAGPNGCSTKMVVKGGTANNGPYDVTNCGVDIATGLEASAAPEPASMILLGTGLAGVAAARRRRRREQV